MLINQVRWPQFGRVDSRNLRPSVIASPLLEFCDVGKPVGAVAWKLRFLEIDIYYDFDIDFIARVLRE